MKQQNLCLYPCPVSHLINRSDTSATINRPPSQGAAEIDRLARHDPIQLETTSIVRPLSAGYCGKLQKGVKEKLGQSENVWNNTGRGKVTDFECARNVGTVVEETTMAVISAWVTFVGASVENWTLALPFPKLCDIQIGIIIMILLYFFELSFICRTYV